MLNDEKAQVTRDCLEEVLNTRIGGVQKQKDSLNNDGHFMNSTAAVNLGDEIWGKIEKKEGSVSHKSFDISEESVKEALAEAVSSRRKESSFSSQGSSVQQEQRKALVSKRPQATKEDVQEWLDELSQREMEDGRPYVNAEQYHAVSRIAEKVQTELPNRRGRRCQLTEPLRWVIHGGPGTGKSHVVSKIIKEELFDQVLHWKQGLDYQIVALQAVMADLLQGETWAFPSFFHFFFRSLFFSFFPFLLWRMDKGVPLCSFINT